MLNQDLVSLSQVSGIMLVECIRWALPQSEATIAALGIANMSGDLVGSKLSHRTLQGVLRLVTSFDLSCSSFSLFSSLARLNGSTDHLCYTILFVAVRLLFILPTIFPSLSPYKSIGHSMKVTINVY